MEFAPASRYPKPDATLAPEGNRKVTAGQLMCAAMLTSAFDSTLRQRPPGSSDARCPSRGRGPGIAFATVSTRRLDVFMQFRSVQSVAHGNRTL